MVYLLFFIFILLMGYIFSNAIYPKKWYVVFYFVTIGLFWGLSYIDAPDTPGYIYKFNHDIQPLPRQLDTQFELGYSLLGAIIKTVYPHYWLFQLVVFVVELLLIIKGLKYFFSEKVLLCVIPLLFFLYPTHLAAFRQGIATSIYIFALQYIYDENFKKSLLYPALIIVATFFHQSVIMLILIYFIRFGRNILSKNRIIIIFLILCDLVWFSGTSLLSQFKFLQLFFALDSMDMGQKYINSMEIANLDNSYGVAKLLEINVATIVYFISCKKDINNGLLRLNMILYIFAGLCIGGLIGHRLNYYWSLLYYCCFVRGFISFLSKNMRYGYLFVGCYMFWFYIIRNYMNKDYEFLFNF